VILGLISDVHANIVALEAVMQKLEEHQVDTIVCLGDVIGYGPAPNEVIELLRKKRVMCTLGGSDERVAFDFIGARRRRGVADKTIEWTHTVIEKDNLNFLRTLPVQARLRTPVGRLRYFHSGLNSPSESLKIGETPAEQMQVLDDCRCKILAIGKSHVPFTKELKSGWIINPGSVGLTLNGEPGADYAVLKISKNDVDITMGKVDYDYNAVNFEIVAWDLPEMIGEAVQLGRMPRDVQKGVEDVKIQKIGAAS